MHEFIYPLPSLFSTQRELKSCKTVITLVCSLSLPGTTEQHRKAQAPGRQAHTSLLRNHLGLSIFNATSAIRFPT